MDRSRAFSSIPMTSHFHEICSFVTHCRLTLVGCQDFWPLLWKYDHHGCLKVWECGERYSRHFALFLSRTCRKRNNHIYPRSISIHKTLMKKQDGEVSPAGKQCENCSAMKSRCAIRGSQ